MASQSSSGSNGDRASEYKRGSLTLLGSVSMGTGVMVGAGIFALTGQIAELSGRLFPLAFLVAAIIVAFSAYSYIVVCRKEPSAGGIAMILKKAYGPGAITAGNALLMYFSMVINESLVARTFGTYTMRLFGEGTDSWLVPALGAGLVVTAFVINLLGNKFIDRMSKVVAIIKLLGVGVFAIIGLWVSGLSFETLRTGDANEAFGGVSGFLAAAALAILAYKGFTTITNSGAELKEPKKNVARSIIISISICTVLYMLVTLAVAGNLSVNEIIGSRDSALAEAARPAIGPWGEWLTIGLAIIATVSGIVASMFAVSRMLAMLTEMELVPHRHFGMPGRIQKHTLVYTAVLALLITIFFDLSRIASLGVILYIIMDMAIHWGIFRYARKELNARAWILLTALTLDAIVLAAFIIVKAQTDPLLLGVAGVALLAIFGGEWWFLRRKNSEK